LVWKKTERKLEIEGLLQTPSSSAGHTLVRYSLICLSCVEEEEYWTGIAGVRTIIQRLARRRGVFVDQAHMKVNPGPTHGLALVGHSASVKGKRAKQWEDRVDFMGAVSGSTTLAIEFLTPKQRKDQGVRGWCKRHVLTFFRRKLARSVRKEEIDGVIVVVDKALRIRPHEIVAEMEEGGCRDIKRAIVMPPSTAKYLSPLDNTLWHQLKENVRNTRVDTVPRLVKAIRKEWKAITPDQLHHYWRLCGLRRRDNRLKGRR
jgi:hypothetical protein